MINSLQDQFIQRLRRIIRNTNNKINILSNRLEQLDPAPKADTSKVNQFRGAMDNGSHNGHF